MESSCALRSAVSTGAQASSASIAPGGGSSIARCSWNVSLARSSSSPAMLWRRSVPSHDELVGARAAERRRVDVHRQRGLAGRVAHAVDVRAVEAERLAGGELDAREPVAGRPQHDVLLGHRAAHDVDGADRAVVVVEPRVAGLLPADRVGLAVGRAPELRVGALALLEVHQRVQVVDRRRRLGGMRALCDRQRAALGQGLRQDADHAWGRCRSRRLLKTRGTVG